MSTKNCKIDVVSIRVKQKDATALKMNFKDILKHPEILGQEKQIGNKIVNYSIVEENEKYIIGFVRTILDKDLPAKIEVDDCKNIEISLLQRQLYIDVVNRFKKLSAQGNQGAMLTSLHSMRMICAHPLQFQPSANLNDSPKVNWLIKTLESIKQKNEKVIIFTEFRDIQVFLKRILLERFGVNVTTVNGDSNSSSKKGLTRQNLIDKFQEKSKSFWL